MKFESIIIKNFRNFKDIKLELTNKNIFFGLNDVGKTNFLSAIRYIFDKNIRRMNLLDSDFHNRNLDEAIEIVMEIDIKDTTCIDSQKLRAKLKGLLLSEHDKVYIKLKAEYDEQEMIANPILYWGGEIDNLQEMKQRGYLYELDYIFNVIYLDSYIDLNVLFRKNIKNLIKNDNEEDHAILDEVQKTIDSLNNHISSLSGIKTFEKRIEPEYKKFRNDGISVSVKSEIAVKGLYSNIIPYIKQSDDENLYPTAGEGRKKLLCYSIYDLLADDNSEKKINLFLIEEPENHLHKSMQIALSNILFTDDKYNYLFVSTHSPYILYEMDNVNLVRIYSERKITSSSYFYHVPEGFEDNRKMLNQSLVEAVFSDRVLLVEGTSEKILFNKVLSTMHKFYEVEGIFILSVDGVGFKPYVEILKNLKISVIIKTDNDLRIRKNDKKYSVLGFSRCNSFLPTEVLPVDPISENTIQARKELYEQNRKKLDEIRADEKIYLSKVDLENDLDEIMHERLSEILETEPVKYLQEAKKNRMVELVNKLKYEDCKLIYDNYNFECLKEIVEWNYR